jgi:predicted GTPase
MGPTGSGKSTVSNCTLANSCVVPESGKFINLATGVDAGVGHDLESFTSEIGIIKMTFLGCNVVFVDTPGFDDTKRSDSDILKMISDWLELTYVIPGGD